MNLNVYLPVYLYVFQSPGMTQLQESIESVREGVAAMDRRLQFHMAYVSGDLEQLAGSVRNIHTAILEDQTPASPDTTTPATRFV